MGSPGPGVRRRATLIAVWQAARVYAVGVSRAACLDMRGRQAENRGVESTSRPSYKSPRPQRGFLFSARRVAIRSWLILLCRACLRRGGLCTAFDPRGHRQRGRKPAAAIWQPEHSDRQSSSLPGLPKGIH